MENNNYIIIKNLIIINYIQYSIHIVMNSCEEDNPIRKLKDTISLLGAIKLHIFVSLYYVFFFLILII